MHVLSPAVIHNWNDHNEWSFWQKHQNSPTFDRINYRFVFTLHLQREQDNVNKRRTSYFGGDSFALRHLLSFVKKNVNIYTRIQWQKKTHEWNVLVFIKPQKTLSSSNLTHRNGILLMNHTDTKYSHTKYHKIHTYILAIYYCWYYFYQKQMDLVAACHMYYIIICFWYVIYECSIKEMCMSQTNTWLNTH